LRSMSNYISFKNLLNGCKLIDFEFLDHLTYGPQPYKKSGLPLDCPPELSAWHKLNDKINSITGKLNLIDSDRITGFKTEILRSGKDLKEIKKDFRSERETLRKKLRALEKKHNEQSPDSWEYFEKPTLDTEILEILTLLRDTYYRKSDEVEFKNKLRKIISQNGEENGGQYDELIKAVRPETELLYNAIKSVGFSGRVIDPGIKYQQSALRTFKEKRKSFKYIQESYLEDKYLYDLRSPRRDFMSRLRSVNRKLTICDNRKLTTLKKV